MKFCYRILLFLFVPVLLSACEEGVFGPRQISCLEYRRTSRSNSSTSENTTEREYEGNRLVQTINSANGTPLSRYTFTYGSDGRISEIQLFSGQNSTPQVPYKVSYNEKGKWVSFRSTNTTGNIAIFEAEYNSQNQIQKYTSSTDRAGVKTVNYTITYEWEGGNNTVVTFVSPTFRQVIRNEFDLSQENKSRKEQEKTAFLSNSVAHNRNMLRRSTSSVTTLTTGVTTQTVSDYSFEYNEAGYPERHTRTTTTGTATPTVVTTTYEYSCN